MLRVVYKLCIPGGPIVALSLLAAALLPPQGEGITWLAVLPAVSLVAGAAVCGKLGRSHAVLVAILILMVDWGLRGLHELVSLELVPEYLALRCFSVIGFLVPLNLAYLGLAREHGLFANSTRNLLALLLAQPLLLVWLLFPWPHEVALMVEEEVVALDGPTISSLAQPIWGAFLGAMAALAAMRVHAHGDQAGGFLWALVAILAALHLDPPSDGASVLFAGAGVAILCSSWRHTHRRLFWNELTDLPTRRALMDRLARTRELHTLAIVDIDHAKRIRSRYTEEVSEQLARSVAFKLATVRGGGLAHHLQQDRFAVLFPGKTPEEALPYVESIRMWIRETPFYIRGMVRRSEEVSVSIGMAESTDPWSSPSKLLQASNTALLQAKDDGRNCTMIFGSESEAEGGDPLI